MVSVQGQSHPLADNLALCSRGENSMREMMNKIGTTKSWKCILPLNSSSYARFVELRDSLWCLVIESLLSSSSMS